MVRKLGKWGYCKFYDLSTVSKNWPIEYKAIKMPKYQNTSLVVEYTKNAESLRYIFLTYNFLSNI
jgi:hypothetical protein